MSVKFARGKLAFGYCDRCYFQTPLSNLVFQIVAALPTGLKVCSECNDKDNPQLQLGKFPINDPVALLNPRPDINPGRSLFGWAPIGNEATRCAVSVGTVYVRPA